MLYEPQVNDFVTTVSFNRGRIVRINNNESGCVLTLRVKDMRTQTNRDIFVSVHALIRVVRNQVDFAIKRGKVNSLLPMNTSWGEEEYIKYARNRPIAVQDHGTHRDEAQTHMPKFLIRETRVADLDSPRQPAPAA
jgi:hypothetical protein